MTRQARLATALRASLIADALVLPAHWIYDPAALAGRFGRLTEILPPPADGYHAGQPAGGQTHYGVQTLALMAALQGQAAFDPEAFMAVWEGVVGDYTGYRDGATKITLANLAADLPRTEAGSPSSDLGGASRIAPLLVALDGVGDEAVVAAAKAQTRLTHRDPGTGDAAAFLALTTRRILSGATVAAAMAAAATEDYDVLPVADYLAIATDAVELGPTGAVQRLGASCDVTGALPATMALALAYGADLETALIENAMAGGDSAARGLALGMMLGAVDGAVVPPRWLAAWQAAPQVEAFLTGR
jgi:ADP-ribosylglycohydrolase